MATSTCGSLHHIFDTLLPEKPTLLESLSWNQIKPLKPTDQTHSFTEIFGELHFKEIPTIVLPSTSSSSSTEITNNNTNRHKSSDSFSSLSSESLHLCTEGLGSESSDDVEDLKGGMNENCQVYKEKEEGVKKYVSSRVISEYPPPISCIGKSGKPWVFFKSYRSEGRFVLEQIRIPTHEFLHACREDGRLKLHFVHSEDDQLIEEEDDGVETMDGENDDCVTEYVNEENDIDARSSH